MLTPDCMTWLGSVWLPLAGSGGSKHRWRGAFGCTVAGRDGDSATRASKMHARGKGAGVSGGAATTERRRLGNKPAGEPFGLPSMSSLAPWLLHQSWTRIQGDFCFSDPNCLCLFRYAHGIMLESEVLLAVPRRVKIVMRLLTRLLNSEEACLICVYILLLLLSSHQPSIAV